jgi:hypothetical protein
MLSAYRRKYWDPIIKPHSCGFWRSRNTRVMVFGSGNTPPPHRRSRGFPGQRPSRVCFCSLRNHTSVVLIPEFHTPTSPWRRDDVTPTEPWHHVDPSNNTHDVIEDPDDTDATEEIRITRMLYLIFLYHAWIPRLDRWTPRVKFC